MGIDPLFTQYIQRAFRTILASQKCLHSQDFPSFFQVRIYFFYTFGDNIWSSAHTLGPILIRNIPKCSKLNCRQFEYIFVKIYSTLSRNFFKKRVRAGETLAARHPPQPPKNFERSILLAGQFPTRISKNCDSSYYNARGLATFKTSTIKKNFFQKMIE